MSKVSSAADGAADESAVDKGGSAYAGSKSKEDDVVTGFGGAHPDFSEERCVGVVDNLDGRLPVEGFGPVKALKADHASWHEVDGVAVARGYSGSSEAYWRRALGRPFFELGADGFEPGRFTVYGLAVESRGAELLYQDAALRVEEAEFNLSSAQVDADDLRAIHY